MRQPVYSNLLGSKIKTIETFDSKNYVDLYKLGIQFHKGKEAPNKNLFLMHKFSQAMDAYTPLQPTITTATIPALVQFLQNWLPGLVKIITAKRAADELMGIMTTGSWEDEQVVQTVLENLGFALPYGDYTNIPFDSWNTQYNYRTVVRFEQGMKVAALEEARSSRINIDTGSEKRNSAAEALEIVRNQIAMFGYNSGNNLTYGFLNDPNLPNYYTVATGASSSTLWSTKTLLEICNDIRTAITKLRLQAQDRIDPRTMPMTLALPTSIVDYLSQISDFGYSVYKFLAESFPTVRVVSAPELELANGGANVFYIYADSVRDASTDGGRTWIQPVPAKLLLLGVEKTPKGYIEDYSNATAGAFLKRPYAVIRASGI